VRRLGVLALAFALFVPAAGHAAGSVSRAGVFTGYAFDACSAPSVASLQAWSGSPYRAVGVYIGGGNRACGQPNLTASWVQTVTGMGWSLLPLYVGLQAPCASSKGLAKLSASTSTAAAQGRAAADDAAAKASALGLPTGSPVWFDMEGYHLNDATCSNAVRAFVGAWNGELRAQGLVPGVYGSAASTIRDIESGAAKPDLVWIANWNANESVFGDPYVSDALWPTHQRIHQYKGGHRETYAGVTINVDSNVVDSLVVGGSSLPTPPPPPTPPPAGQVNSGDGKATASWPAAAFAAPVAVTLTPQAPPAGVTYSVQLTVTETDNQAPVDGFGSPVTVHLLTPPTGLVPAFSSDGATWKPLPKLTAAGVSESVLTAYSVDPDGTYEIQTLVPGFFGLVADTAPPTAPTVSARLLPAGLYLSWRPATDNAAIASYTVLRNGLPITTLTPAAHVSAVRNPGVGAQTVYRVRATDVAGNLGVPSRAIVVRRKSRPSGLPHAIPQWAYGLLSFQHHHGARPAKAPKKPPAWYWRWAAWRTQPYGLR
jgi:Domain of unknown function (DUF1906)